MERCSRIAAHSRSLHAMRRFGVVALTDCNRLHIAFLADATADAGFLSKVNVKGVLPNAGTYHMS